MRTLALKSLVRAQSIAHTQTFAPTARWLQQQHRGLAKANDRDPGLVDAWFSSGKPCPLPSEGSGSGSSSINSSDGGFGSRQPPPNERTLKLGKTIRILQERLPSLLISPLPQEILSPQITLQLFPSTHPHLPTVTGRIAYTAALWTSPVAWGRVPVLGNVKLIILSERMVKNGVGPFSTSSTASSDGAMQPPNEKLIVRWKTCPKAKANSSLDKISEWMGGDAVPRDKEFHGLFLFEFDSEGRVLTHIIEHAEEGCNWDRTTKVISVTDWLLGRAWGKREEEEAAGLALGCYDGEDRTRLSHSGGGAGR